MMQVIEQPEPDSFDDMVRKPGRKWLESHCIDPDFDADSSQPIEGISTLMSKSNADYWKKCRKDIFQAYNKTCAYLGIHIYYLMDAQIDHFLPKSLFPHRAYDWSNYRLSCCKVNNRKGSKIGILDPFEIGMGWFVLSFDDFYVYPSDNLSEDILSNVRDTIKQLDLNNEEYVEIRRAYYREFNDKPNRHFLKKYGLSTFRVGSAYEYPPCMPQ